MSAPILTNIIDQSFFIDALNGASNSSTFLSNFPDAVYNKSVDSHLSILMYALLGPAGAGLLEESYFLERLQTEAGNITDANLDALYTGAFGFQRLTEESYLWDAQAQLLPVAQRAQILAADASFRNRARLWIQAVRAGGSVLGISLTASSGLGQNVEAIENYKALVDQYTDAPLRLPYLGSTDSLDEVVLIPRNNIPQNVAQTFEFSTIPTSGEFTIIVPIGPPFVTSKISMTFNADGTVTVPNSKLFSANGWFYGPNIDGGNPSNVWTCTAILGSHTITTNPVYTTGATFTGGISISRAETAPIPYNATADTVREALGVLPIIGGLQNVVCLGGPLPYKPIQVIFTGELANTSIGSLVIKTIADVTSGSSGLTPATTPIVDVGIAGTDIDGLGINFAEADLALMLEAVDILRPQTSLISVVDGQSLYTRQSPSSYFADQAYVTVQPYVTGNPAVNWPSPDNITNWIEPDIEHEAPQLSGGYQSQYTNFHNILDIVAYNEGALVDPNYNTPQAASVQPFWASYYDTHVGKFNQVQQLLYPMLSQYQDSSTIYQPMYAEAIQPNQPLITTVTNDLVTLINDTYPTSYLNLPGVNYNSLTGGPFWSSYERATGTDYLEIDLGSTQPVNFICFEATNKPYSISVAYESLDQPNSREFIDAEISTILPSVTSLSYSASNTNPWTIVYLPITNALDTMIYSRYIRIGFTRTSQGEPFQIGSNQAAYSIEVRNLRIGRVANSFGVSFTSAA
jgi:hypothetical protein